MGVLCIKNRIAPCLSGLGDFFRIGLDHLALAIADAGELEGLREQLDAAGVPNHGIEPDPATGATYISFYDPDGIAWELYALPAQ